MFKEVLRALRRDLRRRQCPVGLCLRQLKNRAETIRTARAAVFLLPRQSAEAGHGTVAVA